VFTAAIGNADAHGKNISLLIDTVTGAVALAPLYDTVPTALWPRLRAESAMSVNNSYGRPSFDDFVCEATRWGMGSSTADRIVHEILVNIRDATSLCEHTAVADLLKSRLAAIESSRAH
jgi:serine/threonine-protein kinase HipA